MKRGDLTKTIRELAARPVGVSLREVADALDRPLNVSSGFVTKMVRQYKELHKAGLHGQFRYFADPEKAKQHDIDAEEARVQRVKEYKKRQNQAGARRKRAARMAARAAKGLPPYVPPEPGKKVLKPKKVDLTLRNSKISFASRDDESIQKRLHKTVKVIWPENVKVQVIPRGEDTRYKFIPPEGWKGQITKDWYDRRMAA